MPRVNQSGHPYVEQYLFNPEQLSTRETSELMLKLVEHLNLEVWRVTQGYGKGTELELRPKE